MNFLRTLFWVVVALLLAIFAAANWHDVSINLWADLQAEVKLPFLLLVVFLIGFLPPFLVLRGRIWTLRRKLALADRPVVAPPPPTPEAQAGDPA